VLRFILFVAVIVLAAGPSDVVVRAVRAETSAVIAKLAQAEARLEKAAVAIDEGRYADALSLISQARSMAELTSADLDWTAYLTARALAGQGDSASAERTIRERQKANPNPYTWASMVSILALCGKHEPAAQAILGLGDSELGLANRLRPAVMEAIASGLGASDAGLRDKLVERLVTGRYTGPSAQGVPDSFRLRYINLLLRQNRTEDAARETLSLESPGILSILLTDKSFQPIWSHPAVRTLMAPGALVARVERGIQARLEQRVLSSSDWLELMRAQRVIGRADEAVRLGLHALEQARNDRRAAGPALRLEIANAYADTGESWAARRTARELLKEEAVLPVQLRLAVAQVLEETGDDEGALLLIGTMEGADRLAPALAIAVCAAHGLGRNERRDEAMKSLEMLADAPLPSLLDAYVCTGQQPKAAQVLSSMFAKPELRTTAILTAQLYADPAKAGSDQKDLRYRMRALVASNEVQDAVKAYARTLGLPFTLANSK
jgi:tetratricopeptide (TPR) repeat protein